VCREVRIVSHQQRAWQELPAPIGTPAGVFKQMKRRKYAPTPYWRMINRKGPQGWPAGKKLTAEEREFDSLKPAEQEKLLKHMQQSAWWKRQHAKRLAAMEQQRTEGRSAAVRGPAHEGAAGNTGMRGRSTQSLAEQDAPTQQRAGMRRARPAQSLASAAPARHRGMAERLGEVIGLGACSVLGIAC